MNTNLPTTLTGKQITLIVINLFLFGYIISPTGSSDSHKIVEIEETEKHYIPIDNDVQEMRIAAPVTSTVKFNFATQKQIEISKIVKDPVVLNFICKNNFLQRAYDVYDETGVLVSTIVAQKGVESNWGRSGLTKYTKNLSNIKCTRKSCKRYNIKVRKGQIGSSTDHCIQLYDDKPSDRFVKLNSNWEGWNTYKNLLKSKRFKSVGTRTTVIGQAQELKRKGWATQHDYASTVTNAATKYKLLELQNYIDKGYNITAGNGKYMLLKQ